MSDNNSDIENRSIWGEGDSETLDTLEKVNIKGNWLNLGAGDGRYNRLLLDKADHVLAVDIDENALKKLQRTTPKELREKLDTKVFDITNAFPLETGTFDGILCTGTLHLFPKHVIRKIIREIDRVLKSNGQIIIDFASDIKRTLSNGQQHVQQDEVNFVYDVAEKFLRKAFDKYTLEIKKGYVPAEEINVGNLRYKFSCKFVLLLGEKK